MKRIIDSTLREGERAPGVCFRLADRLALVGLLAEAGVDEIEIGHGAGDPDVAALVAAARKSAPGVPLAVWCRALPEDIEAAAALRADRVAMSLPVSDEHLEQRLGRDRWWLMQQLRIAADWARAAGCQRAALGLEDVTRADPEFLRGVLQACADVGLDRVRLADTLGLASPSEFARLVALARGSFDGEIAVHCHNDYGLATANAIAGLEAGADLADGTVLGIGERGGVAATEQLVAWLALRRGIPGYKPTALAPLCSRVARMAGRSVPDQQPIVGKRIFAVESGLRGSESYEPFQPSLVGRQRRILLGKHAGRSAVAQRLRLLGLSDERAVELAKAVREAARTLGRPITDQELQALVERDAAAAQRHI
ncbi:MAG: citramalate synthase [Armatimonadetes bacterium]|nr:citramalate synthase [Armatimonadota bacterium]